MGCNGAKFVHEQDVERQTVEEAVDSSLRRKLTVPTSMMVEDPEKPRLQ